MPKLTLLQLSLGVGGKPLAFAPHVWKTILDLRLLNVEYEVEYVVSAQLEMELPERFGLKKVTIPVCPLCSILGTSSAAFNCSEINRP